MTVHNREAITVARETDVVSKFALTLLTTVPMADSVHAQPNLLTHRGGFSPTLTPFNYIPLDSLVFVNQLRENYTFFRVPALWWFSETGKIF